MKKLLLFFAFIPSCLFSQNLIEEVFPTVNGKIIYQDVVNVDSALTAQDIYFRTRKWMVDVCKSSKDVIQLDDKENNTLIGKGYIAKGHSNLVDNPRSWFTLKIEAKNGRYRYTLYDIIYEFSVTGYDLTDMNKTANKNTPLEEWVDTSNLTIYNQKKKEKFITEVKVFYESLDKEFKLLLSSLKDNINTKSTEW